MATKASRRQLKGIDFIVDKDGEKKAVIINLKQHRALWEDFYDTLLAQERQNEPRETLDEVRKRVLWQQRRLPFASALRLRTPMKQRRLSNSVSLMHCLA